MSPDDHGVAMSHPASMGWLTCHPVLVSRASMKLTQRYNVRATWLKHCRKLG